MSLYKDLPDDQPEPLGYHPQPDEAVEHLIPETAPWYSRRTWVDYQQDSVVSPKLAITNLVLSCCRWPFGHHRYWGTLAFNFGAFLLPAVYATVRTLAVTVYSRAPHTEYFGFCSSVRCGKYYTFHWESSTTKELERLQGCSVRLRSCSDNGRVYM